jgi:hypothetical protein
VKCVVLLACLALPSVAVAQQACEEGRERIGERCCWPGQTFSTERLRCEGEPTCPSALVLHGETCVARASIDAAPLPPPPTDATPTDGAPTMTSDPLWGAATGSQLETPDAYGITATDWPIHGESRPYRAARVSGRDEGLITFALSVFDFGFVLGWLTALLDEVGHECAPLGTFFGGGVSCNGWPLAFIPIGGGVASGFASFGVPSRGRIWGYVLGIPSVILQLVGTIAAIIAFSNTTSEIGFQPIGDPHGVSLSLVPSAPGTDLGGSLVLSF